MLGGDKPIVWPVYAANRSYANQIYMILGAMSYHDRGLLYRYQLFTDLELIGGPHSSNPDPAIACQEDDAIMVLIRKFVEIFCSEFKKVRELPDISHDRKTLLESTVMSMPAVVVGNSDGETGPKVPEQEKPAPKVYEPARDLVLAPDGKKVELSHDVSVITEADRKSFVDSVTPLAAQAHDPTHHDEATTKPRAVGRLCRPIPIVGLRTNTLPFVTNISIILVGDDG